jgi:sugar O-acyltransferase (sialic acid O-acetyltransferase NeuD family)
MKRVIIVGVGGYCLNLIDIMRDMVATGAETLEPAGFLDDDPGKIGGRYGGLPVLGPIAAARSQGEAFFVNGIGSSETFYRKAEIIERIGLPDERYVTLRHPSAFLSPSACVGAGTVLAQNCVVMANATIGRHVKTLPNCTISYGCQVGDYGTVASGAVLLADSSLDNSCYMGANAAVRERVHVGARSLIAMGCVVLRDVAADSIVVGNPARLLRPTPTASERETA